LAGRKVERTLDTETYCTPPQRLGCEIMTIAHVTGNTEEQMAGTDVTASIREGGGVERGVSQDTEVLDFAEEVFDLHRARF
jgi:hypothetical protein